MERKVPTTASDEIDLYLRTIYSLLRSTTDVQIRSLEEVHAGIKSSLHPDVRKPSPDTSAFIYSILRLPECMPSVRLIVLGQSAGVFAKYGFEDIEYWTKVIARARRRRCYYNGKDILACFIASRTDIDDVIPILTAYQIEWNKLNFLLQQIPIEIIKKSTRENQKAFSALAESLLMSIDDLDRLFVIWGSEFPNMLQRIADQRCELRVRLLSGSLIEYSRATRAWWDNIETVYPQIEQRPIYFVSSNTHSIPNLLSGFALTRQDELIEYLHYEQDQDLLKEWNQIQNHQPSLKKDNFLYYILKKYQQTEKGKHLIHQQIYHEQSIGVTRIQSEHYFDVEAQVIDLSQLQTPFLDPRLSQIGIDTLQHSNSLILNIDYPLGLSAYHILSKVAENIPELLGVYVMGKAATLNGILGDVMIPNVVHDEHSQNTYMFNNIFTSANLSSLLDYGSALDNQKGVSVLGTFLQNAQFMDVFYREGYTIIEMEMGSYLSAIYEMYRPRRHPVNEIVNLYGVPFDIGVLFYASDTPLSKGKNLGAGTLSYRGMDSTYATSLAILHRIFLKEQEQSFTKASVNHPKSI